MPAQPHPALRLATDCVRRRTRRNRWRAAGASSEGHRSSGLYRTPCATHNGSWMEGGQFMQPVSRR